MLMKMLQEENLSCVVQQKDAIYKADGRGILPILNFYKENKLQDANVADKVIGKAAAMMMCLGGVKHVETVLISEPAYQFFITHNVEIIYHQMVSNIMNRTQDGTCPMEESVLDIEDMQEAYLAIQAKLAQLMKK